MQWNTYDNRLLGCYEYVTADMPADKRYRPGYVNCVKVIPLADDWFLIRATDGYVQMELGEVQGKELAKSVAEEAIRNGMGRLRAN